MPFEKKLFEHCFEEIKVSASDQFSKHHGSFEAWEKKS